MTEVILAVQVRFIYFLISLRQKKKCLVGKRAPMLLAQRIAKGFEAWMILDEL